MKATDFNYREILIKTSDLILQMPLVKKYRDDFIPSNLYTGCLNNSLIVFLTENARANYFRKTIQAIEKLPLVKRVCFAKPQDGTVSPELCIYFEPEGK